MKKLIFTALVVAVAVGSAFAQEYSTRPSGTGTPFSCQGPNPPTCASAVPGGQAYIYPNGTVLVPLPEESYVP